jgi:putative FmdB family regulatory protein
MPIYDYRCDRCGPFTAMQPMARFQAPRACPECGVPASRTIVSAPAIAGVRATGLRSADPVQPGGAYLRQSSAAHASGCGCCTRRVALPSGLGASGRVFASHGPARRGGR